VARALKSMRPENGAHLVAKLSRPFAAELLSELRPADAGAIIEQLEPGIAAELLQTMARNKPRASAQGASR
jgi:flagellar motility protein MotE (MotC chaperone)